ncbi:MAG: TonB family protein [Myxococcales bacterium]|nr:TonB family protein [Myxococcales bacterium]MCB9708782.1 TonB family protein [Myxococcales bacterium]
MNEQQEEQKRDQGRERPGALTVAMSAFNLKPQGPKVLRIGVIQRGKIIEERVMTKRESVSVGTSERATFVIAAHGLPTKFDLFHLVGQDYILNFTADMRGRVGMPAGVIELEELRTNGGARQAGDTWQVKLTDTSRGKIVIGETTLLFQFVAPPPVQPRPQLPQAAQGGAIKGIDWIFTAFLLLSFMSHFGFVVYLENADWPLNTNKDLDPNSLAARLIFEAPPEPKAEEKTAAAGDKASEESQDSKPQPKERRQDAEPGPKEPGESRAEAQARIAEEAAQAAEQILLGALSSEAAGGALADVLRGGVPIGNAEDVMAQAQGVGVASGASGGVLRTRSGGGQGSGVGGLGGLARAGGDSATSQQGEGGAVVERRVSGTTNVGQGGDIGGSGDFDSQLVVREIRKRLGQIKSCYERELRRNPTLSGKVSVEFTIQESGSVSGAKAVENSTGDAGVAACVVGVISRFRFTPGPEGGSVNFRYPFVFEPQN